MARSPGNLLLAALPPDALARVQADLTSVPAPKRRVFHHQGKHIEHVYFLEGGVGSVTTVLSTGTMVETSTVGREGMIGLEAYFAAGATAAGETMMQVPNGSALELPAAAFRRELDRGEAFAHLMGRYARAVVAQLMQTTACNALHQVQERCCRWLLMTHDRVGNERFELSHEFLAMMLGVRRQSVTVVAGALQAAGLITYRHGLVQVLDRDGLEAASCECYELIRAEFDRVFRAGPADPAMVGKV